MQRLMLGCAAVLTLCGLSLSTSLHADGPSDNIPTNVRPIPPLGIELAEDSQDELRSLVAKIDEAVHQVPQTSDASFAEVAVFSRAIELALTHRTIYAEDEVKQAQQLAEIAISRAKDLPDWLNKELSQSDAKPRLVVGGYRSKIDGSIQPYGLVIPASVKPNDKTPRRLDVWLHGRGEKVCELQFLHQRSQQVGEIAPDDTIVLHPFGRYCNAFKFAGEIDVLEAIEHVNTLLPIDENRINLRGFSMGGAGVWQMAVHYPGLWMAATPGAGFCETQQFLAGFQQEEFKPTKYQSPLLHWYDCPDWGNNLRLLPTIAYSGEIDKQKQAADLMESTLRERGIELTHIIGPQTAHKIHPDSKEEIERRLAILAKRGRDPAPREIDFTTYTLRYPKHAWVSIEGLGEHWKEARVQAKLSDDESIDVQTTNVNRLTLGPFPASDAESASNHGRPKSLIIDGQTFAIDRLTPPAIVSLNRDKDRWTIESAGAQNASASIALRKRPGLQGPIDDAFMSSFIAVAPREVATPSLVDQWAASELKHFTQHWQTQFRGTITPQSAENVSEEDKRTKNLILFGTPASNSMIADAMKRMPIKWEASLITCGAGKHDATKCALIAIYPSPYAADRYIVINSGFTFREYAYLNNARQIAMLPDWAIVDVTSGATTQMPGDVIEADFFDESWQLK
jgi:pimeloyl-ACP methyl ester carboxylesterase